MLQKLAFYSVLASVGLIATGCATIDQMVEEGRNFLGMQEVADGQEPKAQSGASKKTTKEQTKKANEAQARAKAELAKKKEEAERKKLEQAQKAKDCAALVARVKQEDRQYLGDELYSVLKEVNLTCKNLDGFKNTSISSLVPYIKDCRRHEKIDKDDVEWKTSYLAVCGRISNEDVSNRIMLNIQNREAAYTKHFENDKDILNKYPDPEDRKVVIKTTVANKLKNDKGWDKYFEEIAKMQWKPFTGYIVHASSRKHGGIPSVAFEERFNNTGKFTQEEQKALNCRKTNYSGIEYCGEIPIYVNRQALKNLAGGLNPLMQMWVENAPGPTFYVFKLENQKLNVRRTDNNRDMVFNRNIRNAALELGLNWDEKEEGEFANWWVAPYNELIK